jgi:hypothetical protein
MHVDARGSVTVDAPDAFIEAERGSVHVEAPSIKLNIPH